MFGNPVFAFGTGRSGTTLLAKLLDSSSHILYRHEPDKIQPLNSLPFLPEPAEYAQHQQTCLDYLQQLARLRAPFCNTKAPIFEKSFRSSLQTRLLRMLARSTPAWKKPISRPDSRICCPMTLFGS